MSVQLDRGADFRFSNRQRRRPGNWLRVEVDVRPGSTSIPENDKPALQGVSVQYVHEDDIKAVEAKVEDRLDLYEAAVAANWRKFRTEALDRFGVDESRLPESHVGFDWNWRNYEKGDRLGSALQKWPGSPEAEFMNLTGRSVRPLRYVKVLENLGPAIDEQTKVVRDVVQNLSGNAGNADIIARLDALEAENAALKAELGVGTPKSKKS